MFKRRQRIPTPTFPNFPYLHVSSDAKEEAEVDAHGPDVGPGLTADPEDSQVTLLVVRVKPEGVGRGVWG